MDYVAKESYRKQAQPDEQKDHGGFRHPSHLVFTSYDMSQMLGMELQYLSCCFQPSYAFLPPSDDQLLHSGMEMLTLCQCFFGNVSVLEIFTGTHAKYFSDS